MKYNRLSAPWAALQPSILLQTMYIQIKDKENDLYLSQSLSLTHSCLSFSASIFRLKLLMLISFFCPQPFSIFFYLLFLSAFLCFDHKLKNKNLILNQVVIAPLSQDV